MDDQAQPTIDVPSYEDPFGQQLELARRSLEAHERQLALVERSVAAAERTAAALERIVSLAAVEVPDAR